MHRLTAALLVALVAAIPALAIPVPTAAADSTAGPPTTVDVNPGASPAGEPSPLGIPDATPGPDVPATPVASAHIAGDVISIEIDLPSDPMPVGPAAAAVTLGADPGGGTIRWGWSPNDAGSTDVPVGPGGITTLDLGTLSPADWHLYVRFLGFGTYDPAAADREFLVKYPSTTTLTTNRPTATAGELPVALTATVATDSPETPGTVTFLDDVAGAVVELGPVAVDASTHKASYSSNALRVGTHAIRARYDPPTWTISSTSDPVAVTIATDSAVHATFAPSLAHVYPYHDGYRDTVSLGGTLDETATILIRAYDSAGSLRRSWSLGTRVAGRYAVTWNGRTATGASLPAGTYRVTATFKDAQGNTRTITAYTVISWRQATWKSVTVVRYGDQLTYAASSAAGNLFYSADYTHGRTMVSDYLNADCDPCVNVYGTTSYALVSTALDYRSVRIGIEGHGFPDYHPGTAYLVRPVSGAWESPTSLPASLGLGYREVASKTYISSTKRVRIVLFCTEQLGDAFDVHYLKLTYQYAVWK